MIRQFRGPLVACRIGATECSAALCAMSPAYARTIDVLLVR